MTAAMVCAECGTSTATTYVVTQLDPDDLETRTEVCRACDGAIRQSVEWRSHFAALFRAVSACEPPEGSQLDGVLSEFQSTYEYEAVPESDAERVKRWWVVVDDDPDSPRDPYTVCPHCGAEDAISERDTSIRWNSLELAADGQSAVASCGDGDWDGDGWVCEGCNSTDLAAPVGFEITDWI